MAESFEDKYKSNIDKITEAVKFASVSRPAMVSKSNISPEEKEKEELEKEEYFQKVDQAKKDARGGANPYMLEVLNVIEGSKNNKLQENAKLNNWISDKLAEFATYITVNDTQNKSSLKDNTSNIISSANAAPIGGSVYSTESPIKQAITNTIRSYLTDDKWIANTANKYAGRAGRKISNYYAEKGKLPAYAKLATRQFVPEGKESYLDKDTGKVETRRTYEPITDVNREKWFGDNEVKDIAGMLRDRDSRSPVLFGKYSPGEIDSATFDKTNDRGIDNALGIFNYGHYDETGKFQLGIPDLEGNYTVRDRYDWGRKYNSGINQISSLLETALTNPTNINRSTIEPSMQVFGPQSSKGEGRDINFTVPTYTDPMSIMNVMSSRLGPYRDQRLENEEGKESLYSNYLGVLSNQLARVPDLYEKGKVPEVVTPLGQGDLPGFGWQEDAFMEGMPSETEDPGYYDEDIDLKRGGQVSQGLDSLYMNKRDSKQKLHNMMGFQSRQYGGGLDDAYMNRRSAFAAPDTNSAFSSPMNQGGLPTIYRDVGGGVGDNYAAAAEEYADMAAEEEASYFGDGLGDVGDDGRLPGGSPATAPQGGTVGSDVDFNTSSFPTDPNAGVFGTPLQTFAQIKGRLDGNRPEDGYNEVEYTYLNDIMAKTGMPITEAENYLASMMATPGGIAAMEKGFYGDYTGGGPAGTLDNFARGLGDNLGVQGIFDRDKKNKEEEDLLRDQAQGIEPSIFNSIKDIVNRYFKGNKGLETEKGKQEFKDALKSEGATFEPIEESMMQSAFGVANTLANPISGLSSVLEFITGATPKGTVITKEGVRFALDATGALTPEAFLMNPEVDYGNKATSKQRGRPVEKKITETVTKEEEESTPKKSIDSVAMKASNINKLKSYMNLTGKNLSTSKKDLAITDISITEEDFT